VPNAQWLAERFEAERPRLRALAQRVLGSPAEAEDAVQEAWLRLSRSDAAVANLGGWLTTVVSRICLDTLRSRNSRREEPLDEAVAEPATPLEAGPEAETELADALGPALLVVLDTLAPAERVAFVLHDLFGVPFDQVAEILERSPAAVRQLASRARRRVRGQDVAGESAGREVVAAFLRASRDGDFAGLLALLDPDAVVRADAAAVAMGSAPLLSGADAAAGRFAGQANAARLALLDGAPGLIWAHGGELKVAFAFTIESGRITAIDLLADPGTLAGLDWAPL